MGGQSWAESKPKPDINIYKNKYIKDKSNLNLFNLANAYYLNDKFKKAYRGYKIIIKRKGKLRHPAMYYMSLCLIKLNRKKRALKYLNILLSKKLPKNLTTIVKNKKQEVITGKAVEKLVYHKRKSFSIFAEAGVSYNSNPGLDSEAELKFDRNEDSSDTEYRANLTASYWLIDNLKFDSKILASLNYNNFVKNDDFMGYSGSASLPTSFYLGLFRFRLSPLYSTEGISEGVILSKYGASFDIARKFDTGLMSVGYKHYISQPEVEDYNYLEGSLSSVFLSLNLDLGDFTINGKAEFLTNNYIDEDLVESNKGGQLKAGIKYKISPNLYLELEYRYKQKEYPESSLFFNDGVKTFSLGLARIDKLSSYGLSLKYYLNDYIDLNFSMSQLENKSTFDSIFTDVGDKNYSLFEGKFSLGIYF